MSFFSKLGHSISHAAHSLEHAAAAVASNQLFKSVAGGVALAFPEVAIVEGVIHTAQGTVHSTIAVANHAADQILHATHMGTPAQQAEAAAIVEHTKAIAAQGDKGAQHALQHLYSRAALHREIQHFKVHQTTGRVLDTRTNQPASHAHKQTGKHTRTALKH